MLLWFGSSRDSERHMLVLILDHGASHIQYLGLLKQILGFLIR